MSICYTGSCVCDLTYYSYSGSSTSPYPASTEYMLLIFFTASLVNVKVVAGTVLSERKILSNDPIFACAQPDQLYATVGRRSLAIFATTLFCSQAIGVSDIYRIDNAAGNLVLLTLTQSLQMVNCVKPIELPPLSGLPSSSQLHTIGWGRNANVEYRPQNMCLRISEVRYSTTTDSNNRLIYLVTGTTSGSECVAMPGSPLTGIYDVDGVSKLYILAVCMDSGACGVPGAGAQYAALSSTVIAAINS